MKNEQSKIQQPSRPIEMKILRLATLLSEGDDDLDHDGLRLVLDSAGSDSAVLTARLHAAALRLVEDLRSQGETVPLSLEQAIARASPKDEGQLNAGCRHGILLLFGV